MLSCHGSVKGTIRGQLLRIITGIICNSVIWINVLLSCSPIDVKSSLKQTVEPQQEVVRPCLDCSGSGGSITQQQASPGFISLCNECLWVVDSKMPPSGFLGISHRVLTFFWQNMIKVDGGERRSIVESVMLAPGHTRRRRWCNELDWAVLEFITHEFDFLFVRWKIFLI